MRKLVLIVFLIVCISCDDDGYNNCYKDFEICVIGTDYAKIKVVNYSDSSYVASFTFDAQELGYNSDGQSCIHTSQIKAGKYVVFATCPYSMFKDTVLSQIVDYSGCYEGITIYFD